MTMMIFDGTTKRAMTDAEIAFYHSGDAEMNLEFEANARNIRNKLLSDCDWTQVPDAPLSDAEKTSWATYRQELRDITTHANWPKLADADWPAKT